MSEISDPRKVPTHGDLEQSSETSSHNSQTLHLIESMSIQVNQQASTAIVDVNSDDSRDHNAEQSTLHEDIVIEVGIGRGEEGDGDGNIDVEIVAYAVELGGDGTVVIGEDADEEVDEEDVVDLAVEIDYSKVRPDSEMVRGFLEQFQQDICDVLRRLGHPRNFYGYNSNVFSPITGLHAEFINKQLAKARIAVNELRERDRRINQLYTKIRQMEATLKFKTKREKRGIEDKIIAFKHQYNAQVTAAKAMKFNSIVSREEYLTGVRSRECKILPEWYQNICKPHGVKSNRNKNPVKSGKYDPVSKCEPYDDMIVVHESRRTVCKFSKDQVVQTMEFALEKAEFVRTHDPDIRKARLDRVKSNPNNKNRLHGTLCGHTISFGQERVCMEFGSTDQHVYTGDVILVKCPCYPRENAPGVPCGKWIDPRDPKLLKLIDPADQQRFLGLIESKEIDLMRQKYGPEYAQFCINPACKHATTPYMDKTVIDALKAVGTGKKMSTVHINCRSCPSCATSWCKECGQTPYHDRKICPGKIGELIKDLSPAEAADFVKRVKLCPGKGCNTATEIITGCDHMTCRNCSTHWCWRCRGIRDSANSYAHACPAGVDYDKPRDQHDHGGQENDGYSDIRGALDIGRAGPGR